MKNIKTIAIIALISFPMFAQSAIAQKSEQLIPNPDIYIGDGYPDSAEQKARYARQNEPVAKKYDAAECQEVKEVMEINKKLYLQGQFNQQAYVMTAIILNTNAEKVCQL
jgi:hypothetical protein